MTPENTAKADPLLNLLRSMEPGGIEAMEAQGQRELLNSTTLPTDTSGSDEAFLALGFAFGETVPGDDLFRQATLPAGWERKGSDHAMWSYVVDDRGIERVAIFYKAAFYDRRAFMRLDNVGASLASKFIYGDDPTFTLRSDLTDEERGELLASAEQYIEDSERHPDIYADRLPRAWQIVTATRVLPPAETKADR